MREGADRPQPASDQRHNSRTGPRVSQSKSPADPAKAPTIAAVARLAKTSTAVVSYVVNGGPRPVAEETRQRVQEAINELGWRPNRLAQGLSSQRSGLLGLVLPGSQNAFFSELGFAIERTAFTSTRNKLASETTTVAPL